MRCTLGIDHGEHGEHGEHGDTVQVWRNEGETGDMQEWEVREEWEPMVGEKSARRNDAE